MSVVDTNTCKLGGVRRIALTSFLLIASCSSQSQTAVTDSSAITTTTLSLERVFKNSCIAPDFNDCNLYGRDFSGAFLWQAQMSYTDMRGANLSDAFLRQANFEGALLHYLMRVCKLF